jgi:hypothetical protein
MFRRDAAKKISTCLVSKNIMPLCGDGISQAKRFPVLILTLPLSRFTLPHYHIITLSHYHIATFSH